MKYIVCNSETTVLNRMYDEFERYLEDGAVISLPEQIVGSQFMRRMVDDYESKKYRYKHVLLVGQREFADIDIEEDFGLYRYMKKEMFKKLDIDSKNVYYPECLDSNDSINCIENYKKTLDDNLIDVAIIFLGTDGKILDYKMATEDNENVHILQFPKENKEIFSASGLTVRSNKMITMGYENLLNAKNLFLVVLGADKRKYIKEMFENSEEDNKTILSLLNEHKNITIFTDKDASYKSEEEVNRLIRQRQKRKEQLLRESKQIESDE